ncbi:hypothetical protein GCM10010415_12180 [Streptomyces atrovirens]
MRDTAVPPRYGANPRVRAFRTTARAHRRSRAESRRPAVRGNRGRGGPGTGGPRGGTARARAGRRPTVTAGLNGMWAPFRPLTGRGRPKRLDRRSGRRTGRWGPVADAHAPAGPADPPGGARAQEREVPPVRARGRKAPSGVAGG